METDHTRTERRLLDEALRPGCVALDAGCGRTTRLRHYRDRIDRLIGLDSDEAAGRENPFLDEFVPGDLERTLPFADATFDLVYANFVVEHLRRPELAFAEWRRVLGRDGRLVVLTSNRANPIFVAAGVLPAGVRVALKRRGAGVAERDVHRTAYVANTPARLARVASGAGFEPMAVEYVATLHRYGARVPPLAALLRAAERALPASRRSTIVASYRCLRVGAA